MKRFLAVVVILCAVPLFAGGPKKTEIVKAKKKIPNSYIIVFEDRIEDVDRAAGELLGLSRGQLKHLYKSALKGFAARITDVEAARIAQDPRVKAVYLGEEAHDA